MRRVIYKYNIDGPITDLVLRKNAIVMTVQVQRDQAVIWVEEDAQQTEKETRRFTLIGTGLDFGNIDHLVKNYIGTVQLENGWFIGHLYEMGID